MNMEENKSLIKELIKLAESDGKVREAEYNFLLAIANQLSVPKNDFDELFAKHIDFKAPKLEVDRIVQFQRLILTMNIDGDMANEEFKHIRQIGLRLGLQPIAVDTVFREMVKYPNNLIPPDKLIEIFKLYHN